MERTQPIESSHDFYTAMNSVVAGQRSRLLELLEECKEWIP
jgi:hypothetical protein